MSSSDQIAASDISVLVIEPYYGGSHKSFLDGLKSLPITFDFLTLPARNWKWRMRLAAPFFAEQLHETGRRYDRILCSSYLDVAAFRGMGPGWVRNVPLLTYFHENQFAYPVRVTDERDLHFALINVTTALASESIAFNSLHNINTFLKGAENLLKYSADLQLRNPLETIRAKSRILPPGIDFSTIDSLEEPERSGPPVLLWNHRWEHDKNPELFFNALFRLDEEDIDFRLAVLGESFESSPPVFGEARKRLSGKIIHFGYAENGRDYALWLKKSDIVVSTAYHEFFGIAVIEAVRAGCRPLLPGRLSYPELFPDAYLYDEPDLIDRLKEAILNHKRLSRDHALKLTEHCSWRRLVPAYQEWINNP